MNLGFSTISLIPLVKIYSSYQVKYDMSFFCMLKIMFLDMHVSFLVQNDRDRINLLQPLFWFIDFVCEFLSVNSV